MPHRLEGKPIVITGASSGIGAATARACAAAGMPVMLVARREEPMRDLAQSIIAQGGRAEIEVLDVTDRGASQRMLDAAEAAFGPVYAVFANAGYGYGKAVIDETDQDIRRIFEVNFFASHDLVRLAAQRLLNAKRPGHLIMCASCVSKFGLPYHGAYSATKAAQDMICDAMRVELRGTGVEVSSVHPVTTATEFFETAERMSGPDASVSLRERLPKLFIQSPDRVARAVVRCLRRPKPEVWTSFPTRFACAATTLFPRLHEWTFAVLKR